MSHIDLFSRLELALRHRPASDILVRHGAHEHTVGQILALIERLESSLSAVSLEHNVVALAVDDPVINFGMDLLLLKKKSINMTIPLEFSDDQLSAFLENADVCIVDKHSSYTRLLKISPQILYLRPDGSVCGSVATKRPAHSLPASAVKIVHTSGTTSHPKGAILSDVSLDAAVANILERIDNLDQIHYCSFQPLSLLIEQIFSFYLPILSGGSVSFLPPGFPRFGLIASKNTNLYLFQLIRHEVNFFFLPPRLIEDLSNLVKTFNAESDISFTTLLGFRNYFMLTGGARVKEDIIRFLDGHGIVVHEAYGTSENGSVICMNSYREGKIGTVGRPLINNEIKIIDGEIVIRSNSLFTGYLKDRSYTDPCQAGYYYTGDLGEITEDGYIKVTGRKKHLIILSSGRNISPEHVESTYRLSENVKHIVVFGEGQPGLTAVIWPTPADIPDDELKRSLQQYDEQLPTYARIAFFITVRDMKEDIAKYFTTNSRPRRTDIFEKFVGTLQHNKGHHPSTQEEEYSLT